MKKIDTLFSLLRIALGFLFFWAFLDKLFGLGFATTPDKSWLYHGSPTAGFLQYAVTGTFSSFFHALSGNPLVDLLFMLGLLGIGTALLLGICMKIAGYSGALLVLLMYLALFPSENNPLIDEHIIYLLLFLIFATGEVGRRFSLSSWWEKQPLVKRYHLLK